MVKDIKLGNDSNCKYVFLDVKALPKISFRKF